MDMPYAALLQRLIRREVHDIGANTGRFSRLVAGPDRYVVSHDIDELAVAKRPAFRRAFRLVQIEISASEGCCRRCRPC